jgi:hypothetical protein
MAETKVANGSGTPESLPQFIVALAIVVSLLVLGLALVVMILIALSAPNVDKTFVLIFAAVGVPLGTIIGSLSHALNVPTGVSKVIAAARSAPTNPTQDGNQS